MTNNLEFGRKLIYMVGQEYEKKGLAFESTPNVRKGKKEKSISLPIPI